MHVRTQLQNEVQPMVQQPNEVTLFYVHDPMCSWCWGFRPVFGKLRDSLSDQVVLRSLLGGLAPDSDQPMPREMCEHLQRTWQQIAEHIPGTRFNFDFWKHCQPRRSTWPACRAVIAARTLDPRLEGDMVLAIQRAYYLEARNPSDRETLIELAADIGIDEQRFGAQLDVAATQAALLEEIKQVRELGVSGFPGLRLVTAGSVETIKIDYLDPAPMHLAIERRLLEGG
jgi:putative protein-disulfide isomerase